MKPSLRNVSEDWKRAPSALLERVASAGVVDKTSISPPAKVALYARVPETAEKAGVRFALAEAPGGGLSFDAPTHDAYETLRLMTPGLGGTLTFPADYASADYITVVTTVMRPLAGAASVFGSADAALPAAVTASLSIEVGKRAKAFVFLRVGGESGVSSLLLSALKIRVEAGASLQLLILSDGGIDTARVDRSVVVLEEGAHLTWTEAVFDAGPVRSETIVDLTGAASDLEFFGAYGARGKTERERILVERHLGPKTRSRAVLKSVLRDEARLVFGGLIEVFPSAPGTDAYLSNRNLVLDDGARAESLPQLKIDQDDVACSHGSTTGGPREEELFYLMSRGLDRDSARSLIAVGHLGSVLDRVPADVLPELEAAALRTVEDNA
jgi:Fe-S cluster assembly protein SufD